jgi:hypothetical protein
MAPQEPSVSNNRKPSSSRTLAFISRDRGFSTLGLDAGFARENRVFASEAEIKKSLDRGDEVLTCMVPMSVAFAGLELVRYALLEQEWCEANATNEGAIAFAKKYEIDTTKETVERWLLFVRTDALAKAQLDLDIDGGAA